MLSRLVICASLLLFLPPAWRAQEASQVALDPTRFSAKGRNEAILTVGRFGRVSLAAKSKQGTAIQIVDKMTGPGASSGEVGKTDGRVDVFLDAGTYKLVAFSHEKGQGDLDLTAKPFRELSGPQVPVLLENCPVDGKLEDLQQVSYWIQVEERRTVHLEAQGRDLNDLRLWSEGNWLVDALPDFSVAFTATGRPEANFKLSADLNPGYYLVTAYGGPTRRWAKETGEHPLHIRWEFPELASAARIEGKVSVFGEDRFIVPKPANFFLLQLPEKKEFHLSVAPFDPGDSFPPAYNAADITKKSQDPECRIHWNTFKKYAMVTVAGSPGEPYVLQAFEKKDSYEFKGGGRYWISTVHSGYMDDNIDATGILVSSEPQTPHVTPKAADVIHVGGGKSWARRFNLLEEETIFFFAEETGDYEVRASGTEAEFTFEPFMIAKPENYKTPSAKEGSCVWPLDKGYWVLTLTPKLKGILSIEVAKKGAASPDGEIEPGPAKGCAQFPDVTLDPLYTYTLYMNRQEGVDYGVILRPYPLNLLQPLPVILRPGEEIALDFTATEDSQLSLTAVEKAAFAMWLDGAPCQRRCAAAKGSHQLRLKNEGAKTYIYTLLATPARLLPDSVPRSLSNEILATFAKFPLITETSPLFFNFGAQQKQTALLKVGTPALYRIETTGLLQTSCTVRTRTQTSLFSNEAGGVGRNCLVQQYLKDGEYQLTVETKGRSAGHAGLKISRTEIRDGGALALGKEVREDVPSGAAVFYTVDLPKAAKYGFWSIGQSKTFRSRLEDKDGWPLMEPNATAAFERELGAGRYRFMTLPWDVDTLRSTRVEEVLPPKSATGRGPHTLNLNETLGNTWEEPEEGAGRARDLYDFTLPASVDATISLGDEQMQGFLTRKEGGKYEVVETVPPEKKPWSGTLSPGAYRLEVECSRQNDLLPYSVTVSVAQLVAGVSREVTVPAALPVSVSSEGVVELFSTGQLDTRGRLFTSPDWRLVADGDDAFNDWNFRIARKLAPGKYTLYVEGVGGGAGKTRVSMSVPPESVRPPLAIPSDASVDLAGAIQVFPLPVTGGGGLLSVRASGASFLGCILEKAGGAGPVTLAQKTGKACEIDLPLSGSGSYQLRLWSADHLSESARLQVSLLQPQPATLAELESGRTVRRTGTAGRDEALSVSVQSPGTFRIKPAEGFTFSTRAEEPLAAPDGDLVSLPAGTAFLKWSMAGQEVRAQAERVVLKPGDGAVKTDVAAGRPLWIDASGEPGGFSLLTARGEPGRPGCVFPGQGEAGGGVLSPSYALGDGTCAAVGLPGSLKAQVWNTGSSGNATVSLQLVAFKKPQEPEKALPFGLTASEIPAGGQALFSLPPGEKTVDVDLESGLLAFPYDGGAVAGVAWAEAAPARGSFATGAGWFAVLNPLSKPALCSITVLKRGGMPEMTLRPGALFERLFPEAGTLRLRLADVQPGKQYLMTDGTDVASDWMDETGALRQGNRFELKGRPGVLTIRHGAGLVKAWTAAEGKELAARWGQAPEPAPVPAAPNAVLDLPGGAASFALALDKPTALSFISDVPAAAALRKGGGGDFLFVYEDTTACAFDYYLEPGSYVLSLRALAGGTLGGTARLSATEVVPITGTFGPETLLSSNESRTFAFTVSKKGPVGIGLKTESELLDCELLTRDEKLLGQGIQQYTELEPGTYLLRVYAPPGEIPVRFAPAVVGLTPPGDGPPEEYLQEFLQKIGMVEE